LGRFLSIDKLWEKYYGWTPYQYSMNNPISLLDENGLVIFSFSIRNKHPLLSKIVDKADAYALDNEFL
jgi:hypothetical protein